MKKACFHCGEHIPKGFHAELNISGEPQVFCCYGCQAVAETIINDGLDNFYSHRTSLSNKPVELKSDELTQLKLYDDPLLQEEFVRSYDGTNETSLSISGVACAACIWLLEREINAIDGVESFSINHTTHKAFIQWRSPAALSDCLIKARQLGYNAKPYRHHEAKVSAIREKRIAVFRIAIAGIATMQNMMFSIPLYLGMYNGLDTQLISLFRWVSMFMAAPVILFSAIPFYQGAIRSIKAKHLGMDIPVTIALLVAYLASSYTTITTVPTLASDVYFDSVSMFAFFLLLGRFIEMQTRHRYITDDVDMDQLLPETANIVKDTVIESVVSQRITQDDILRVKQGELLAADGIIVNGQSRFDESALTGEFLPVKKSHGDRVHAGTANIDDTVDVRVTANAKDSRLSSIVRLIGKAQAEKPRTQAIADTVASYFVALVLIACSATAWYWYNTEPSLAFAITLSVLVVTCPCALSLATPTALTGATSTLRRLGFLLTKNHALEAMGQADVVIFDKTGTLTEGSLSLSNTTCFSSLDETQALLIASALERETNHPIASAFTADSTPTSKRVDALKNHMGYGVSGVIEGRTYFLGSASFITQSLAPATASPMPEAFTHQHQGPVVYLSDDSMLVARFELDDTLRAEAQPCIDALKLMQKQIVILSGDQEHSVKNVANKVGITTYKASCSPEQKLDYLDDLQSQGNKVVMIGDGINDLPVLSRADLSIAMGGASDLTKLNADAVLLNDHLASLSQAFQYSVKTSRIIKQNIAWAIAYNISMLPLAMSGLVPPYFAALGMSLSSLVVVFNSMRLKK